MITLVAYMAEWCGPCKSMIPVMAELKEAVNDKVIFTAVNIDHSPDLVREHHVRSIPTYILFKDRTEIGRHIGLATKSELEEWIRVSGNLQPGILPEQSSGSDGTGSPVLRSPSGQENAEA